MERNTSEEHFYLIDVEGNRRVPIVVKSQHGPVGYPIHPEGKGNDAKAARYSQDIETVVKEVVLHGRLVRARAFGGKKDGQQNTVGLDKTSIRGYWLHPDNWHWIAGAARRPINEVS